MDEKKDPLNSAKDILLTRDIPSELRGLSIPSRLLRVCGSEWGSAKHPGTRRCWRSEDALVYTHPDTPDNFHSMRSSGRKYRSVRGDSHEWCEGKEGGRKRGRGQWTAARSGEEKNSYRKDGHEFYSKKIFDERKKSVCVFRDCVALVL